MKKDFARLVSRYGREVCLRENGVDTLGRAFVRPLFEKDARRLPTPLGRRERGRMLCLAEPGLALERAGEDAVLLCGEGKYDVVTARPVTVGTDVLFCWAVLQPGDGEVGA